MIGETTNEDFPAIDFSGDVDSFFLDLNAGTTVSIVVSPTEFFQTQFSLSGPDGVLSMAESAAVGQPALLQTIPITTTGTYTITVQGLDNTIGGYTVRTVLNAAIEREDIGGVTNDSLATAQDIDASFLSLGEEAIFKPKRSYLLQMVAHGAGTSKPEISTMRRGSSTTITPANMSGKRRGW